MQELTASDVASELVTLVEDRLSLFEANHAPGLVLPKVFAGHATDELASADLAYVAGLLSSLGVGEIVGVSAAQVVADVIRRLDPDRVEDFAAYRIGETALRLGGLDALDDDVATRATRAALPTETLRAVRAGERPPNYAVVAARGLYTYQLLTGDEPPELAEFVDRSAALLSQRPNGWINDGFGSHVHFDIYSPDMYLFAEPLADMLGDVWRNGLTAVLGDLDDVASPGGTVFWGRSIGALGMAITIELAAVAAARELAVEAGVWLRRAVDATATLSRWFPNGVISAHQHRSTMFYRGPSRRLQMTLDIYGKFLLAAQAMSDAGDVSVAERGTQWAPVDRFIDIESPAGLWSHRSRHFSFTLPIIHGWSSDYLATPRGPGLFESPTSGPVCFAPVLHTATDVLVPAGLANDVDHSADRLTLRFDGFAPVGSDVDHSNSIGGKRLVRLEATNRSLMVDEDLGISDFDDITAVSITIPEIAARPLEVEILSGPDSASMQTIDTSGIAEWRSFWSEIDRVHQITVDVEPEVSLRYRVTAQLRVMSTTYKHPYDEGLYAPLRKRLAEVPAWTPDEDFFARLHDVDVLHMAWPEWFSGVEPSSTEEIIARIGATRTPIVWTQHNLVPHLFKTDEARACYAMWAKAAAAVIHHHEYGRAIALDTYDYGEDTEHAVIHHGHWGPRFAPFESAVRVDVEEQEGWSPCGLRLAVVGAPRSEKHLQDVVDAVVASSRDDVQLVIRADDDTTIPDDPRIVVDTEHLDDHRYLRRMKAFDALVLPFAPSGMLTTGTAFDAIGAGIAAITSDWGFFDETFAGADIRYGSGVDDLRRCIEGLDSAEIARSAEAMRALQPRFEWSAAADATFDLFERVCPR